MDLINYSEKSSSEINLLSICNINIHKADRDVLSTHAFSCLSGRHDIHLFSFSIVSFYHLSWHNIHEPILNVKEYFLLLFLSVHIFNQICRNCASIYYFYNNVWWSKVSLENVCFCSFSLQISIRWKIILFFVFTGYGN